MATQFTRNKYHAASSVVEIVDLNGKKIRENFPSKLEASVFRMLISRGHSGELKTVERYDTKNIFPGINWKIDFVCVDKLDRTFWVEAKGIETADYRLKKRIWECMGFGPLEIWMGSYNHPYLADVVYPHIEILQRYIDERTKNESLC